MRVEPWWPLWPRPGASRGLPPDEALLILEGVADGLDALHRRGRIRIRADLSHEIVSHKGARL